LPLPVELFSAIGLWVRVRGSQMARRLEQEAMPGLPWPFRVVS
jgi:hypothetical protein